MKRRNGMGPSGAARISEERTRQKAKWSDAHDDEHDERELAMAAATLVLGGFMDPNRSPPWALRLFAQHAGPDGYVRRLEIAGALLAAEIDRVLRADFDQLAEDRKLVERLCKIEEGLSDWEVSFVESLSRWVESRELTPAQRERAFQIDEAPR